MTFFFRVHYTAGSLRLKAELIYKSSQVERFKISGKNRYIIIQNNHPQIIDHITGKTKGKVKWKLFEGELNDVELLIAIVNTVDDYRRQFKKSPQMTPEN